MSASKSHQLSPAAVFGRRVRELRSNRGWSQTELAKRVNIDRTTLNKIEQGTRSDVSISQLFAFAFELGTSPVYLITPVQDDAVVEMTVGGAVMSPADARRWIRGGPLPGADREEFLLELPRDELRLVLRGALRPKLDKPPLTLAEAATGYTEPSDDELDAYAEQLVQQMQRRLKEE